MKVEADQDISNVFEKSKVKTDITQMNYTPVNAETFAIWCEKYKEKLAIEKAQNTKGWENKPSGKELFLANRKAFEDLTLDDGDDVDDDEEIKLDGEEEFKQDDDDEEEEEFKYDRALYDADGLEDEDIDFDD